MTSKIPGMNTLPLLLALIFYFSTSLFGQQQSKLVTGMVVTAEDNAPLEGVMVRIKGTNRHSGSQSDGIYYIEVNASDTALVFTHTGYAPTEIRLTGDAEYSIRLARKLKQPQQTRHEE
jgi:hypothetical protein